MVWGDGGAQAPASGGIQYKAGMFRAALDAMPQVTWLYSEDHARVVYVSSAFERVFARPRAVLDGAPLAWIEQVHPEDQPRVRATLEARAAGGEPAPLVDFRVVGPSGDVRWLRSSIRRVEGGEHDRPAGTFWVETALDVTRERAAAVSVQERFGFAKKVMSLLGAIVVVTDERYRVVWWNDRFAALCGEDTEASRGRHLVEIVGGVGGVGGEAGDTARFEAALAALGRAQHHGCGTRRYVPPGGEAREIAWSAAQLHGANGDVTGFVAVGRDATEEEEARRARRLSDERFGEFARNLPDRSWLYSIALGEFVLVGGRATDIWGRDLPPGPDAMAKVIEFVHPDDRARTREALSAVLQPGGSSTDVEYRIVRPDGAIRWVLTRTTPIRDERGRVVEVAGLTVDVTEARETARALRESEERLRRISEGMRDVFFLLALDVSRVYYINPAFERIFGVPRQAVYARPTLPFEMMHPDDLPGVMRAIAPQQRAERDESEYEARIIRPDGELRWILMRSRTVEDDENGVKRTVGMIADITERKEAERALHERTAELERLLREKDVLLAEVHHRVKNNLQSISSLMHMMAARTHRRPIHETIEELERRIQTMALVHETIYRSSDLAAVDMQAYLERVTAAQLGVLGKRRLAVEIDVDAPAVTLDLDTALRCGLMVNELVQNAVKHAFVGRRRGRIEVRMKRVGDRLLLRVADDGKGLPADLDLDSEATLGLRLVRGLAEQLGGAARRVPEARSAIEIEL